MWCERLRAGERQNKAAPEWSEGDWLGPATGSSETLIGTLEEIVRASSVKRHDPSQRWDKEMVNGMQGAPQQPDPSKPGLRIPVRIRMDPPAEVDMPELRQQREEYTPKWACIKTRRPEESGYTEDCEGCRRLRSGVVPGRPHLECCRGRIYEELAKRENGGKLM